MLSDKYSGEDAMKELAEKLKEKDRLILERDEELSKVASKNNLLENDKKDLLKQLEDAGTMATIDAARRTTTAFGKKASAAPSGEGNAEIERLNI
jgi:peptidoglycan hydrolase CwlO-like protein